MDGRSFDRPILERAIVPDDALDVLKQIPDDIRREAFNLDTSTNARFETLEHNGDKYIGVAVAEIVEEDFPKLNISQRVHLERITVDKVALSTIANRLGLFELAHNPGNRPRGQKELCDLFEALVGAVVLSIGTLKGLAWVKHVMRHLVTTSLENVERRLKRRDAQVERVRELARAEKQAKRLKPQPEQSLSALDVTASPDHGRFPIKYSDAPYVNEVRFQSGATISGLCDFCIEFMHDRHVAESLSRLCLAAGVRIKLVFVENEPDPTQPDAILHTQCFIDGRFAGEGTGLTRKAANAAACGNVMADLPYSFVGDLLRRREKLPDGRWRPVMRTMRGHT